MSSDSSNPAATSSRRLTPERIKLLAEGLVAGLTAAEIADVLRVSVRTVFRWKNDPAVAAEVVRLRNRTNDELADEVLERLLDSSNERVALGAVQTAFRRSERAPKEPVREGGNVLVIDRRNNARAAGAPHDDPVWRSEAYTNLGFVTHVDGDPTRAREYFRVGLQAATEIGLVEAYLEPLFGMAAAEVEVGDSAAAARLFGQAKELALRLGSPDEYLDDEQKRQTLVSLETALGPNRLGSELAAGAALPLEDALDLALDRSDSTLSGER